MSLDASSSIGKNFLRIDSKDPKKISSPMGGVSKIPPHRAVEIAPIQTVKTSSVTYETIGEIAIDKLCPVEGDHFIYETSGAYYIEQLPEPPNTGH